MEVDSSGRGVPSDRLRAFAPEQHRDGRVQQTPDPPTHVVWPKVVCDGPTFRAVAFPQGRVVRAGSTWSSPWPACPRKEIHRDPRQNQPEAEQRQSGVPDQCIDDHRG